MARSPHKTKEAAQSFYENAGPVTGALRIGIRGIGGWNPKTGNDIARSLVKRAGFPKDHIELSPSRLRPTTNTNFIPKTHTDPPFTKNLPYLTRQIERKGVLNFLKQFFTTINKK